MKQAASAVESPRPCALPQPVTLRDLFAAHPHVRQADAARKLGVARSHIARLCGGAYSLDIRHVLPLAELFGLPVETVLRAAVASAPERPHRGE